MEKQTEKSQKNIKCQAYLEPQNNILEERYFALTKEKNCNTKSHGKCTSARWLVEVWLKCSNNTTAINGIKQNKQTKTPNSLCCELYICTQVKMYAYGCITVSSKRNSWSIFGMHVTETPLENVA